MRIKILSTAEDDLEEGHRLYESQADDLGTYFLIRFTLTLTHWPTLPGCTA